MEADAQGLPLSGLSEPLVSGLKAENKSRPILAQVSLLYGKATSKIYIGTETSCGGYVGCIAQQIQKGVSATE
jgi:hypothetical protein